MYPRTRPRKTWRLQDGPTGSLNRLRQHLAEEGCEDSQVSLAKTLLSDTGDGIQAIKNAELAVHWLLKAAKCGHEEAVMLLERCYRSGRGITEKNCVEVQRCLNRTEEEKVAEKAGHVIFHTVMEDNEKRIEMSHFQERVQSLLNAESASTSNGEANRVSRIEEEQQERPAEPANLAPDECVTEADVVKATLVCLQGKSPEISLSNSLCRRSYLENICHIMFPWWVWSKCTQVSQELSPVFPMAALLTAIFCWLLEVHLNPQKNFSCPGDIWQDVLYVIFATAFMSLTSSTLAIVQMKKELQNLRMWIRLVNAFGTESNEDADTRFVRNHLTPFPIFLGGLLLILAVTSQSSSFHFASDCLVLSFLLFLWSRETFTEPSKLNKLSLLLAVISTAQRSGLIGLHCIPWGETFWITYFTYSTEYLTTLHINISSCLFVISILIYVKMAFTNRWQGTYMILLPHLQSVLLLYIAGSFYRHSNLTDMVVSLVFWITVFMLAKLLGVTSAICVMSIVRCVWHGYTWKQLVYVLFVCGIFTASKSLINKFKQTEKSVAKMLILLLVIGVPSISILSKLFTSTTNQYSAVILWEQYHTECHKPAWDETNVATVEINCSSFEGVLVKGAGSVSTVRLSKIDNNLKWTLDLFPKFVRDFLYCIFGKPLCDPTKEWDASSIYCTDGLSKCHLEEWNSYNFELVLAMKMPTMVVNDLYLDVPHSAREFVLNLRRGDLLAMEAILHEHLGSPKPRALLHSAFCVGCSRGFTYSHPNAAIEIKWHSIMQNILDFLFYPLYQSNQH